MICQTIVDVIISCQTEISIPGLIANAMHVHTMDIMSGQTEVISSHTENILPDQI
jgi:hypothetical protein